MLNKWADFLEREGGSVVAAFLLLFIGWGMWFTKCNKAEDVIMIAVGGIGMAIKGRASRPPALPPVGTTSQTTTTSSTASSEPIEVKP